MKYMTRPDTRSKSRSKAPAPGVLRLGGLLLMTTLLVSGCSFFEKKPVQETRQETEGLQKQTESEEVLLVEMTEHASSDELPDNTDFSTEADVILEENTDFDTIGDLGGLISG